MGPKISTSDVISLALSPERQKVLQQVKLKKTPSTVSEISLLLNLHENTIREHLEGLVEFDLVSKVELKSEGRGRPPSGYLALNDFAAQVQPEVREYASLALVLASQLAEQGDIGVDLAVVAGVRWGIELATHTQANQNPKTNTKNQILAILQKMGFSPKVNKEGSVVRLQSCPLLAAAKKEPKIICSVHAGLLRGFLIANQEETENVQLFPFSEPGACIINFKDSKV